MYLWYEINSIFFIISVINKKQNAKLLCYNDVIIDTYYFIRFLVFQDGVFNRWFEKNFFTFVSHILWNSV